MMNTEHISINLRRLRKDRGWTQAELANMAGFSLSGYRKLERARVGEPRPESLRQIARALDVPLRELMVPVRGLERVRFRSFKRLKSREQLLADVAIWLRDFADLEALIGEAVPHSLEELLPQSSGPRPGAIPEFARKVRAAFALDEREPVHDICGLLEARGVKVWSVAVPNDAFMGLSVGAQEVGGPAVIVNTWERLPVETWIFSAAHELGHLLMHFGAYDVHQIAEDDTEEAQANQFASHFLMPDGAFRREWEETAGLALVERVLKVKRIFRVSWRTVLYRVAGALPPGERAGVWARFNLEYKRRSGHTLLKHDEPGGIDAEVYHSVYGERPVGREPSGMDMCDFKEDRLARLVRRALESGTISLSRAAEILGLPLEDMRERTASWVA
ncbi:MAG: helix-turn-helix domain-containing protein [Thioalkalivibrio sp.]|nr:MAG: helix-turn-helix domain-containing protein [Thioalkalivibrio sp.]